MTDGQLPGATGLGDYGLAPCIIGILQAKALYIVLMKINRLIKKLPTLPYQTGLHGRWIIQDCIY